MGDSESLRLSEDCSGERAMEVLIVISFAVSLPILASTRHKFSALFLPSPFHFLFGLDCNLAAAISL
jgi:hypothetical protein